MAKEYGTLKEECLLTLLSKLQTKMPTAGEQEKKLLDVLWDKEVVGGKDKDADQAKQISDQLLKNMNELLKHVDNQLPRPPQGWQPLATAVLGAMLEELDAVETGKGALAVRLAISDSSRLADPCTRASSPTRLPQPPPSPPSTAPPRPRPRWVAAP